LALNNKSMLKGEENFLSGLSYLTIGIFGLFILLSDIKDESDYLKFHAAQSVKYWAFSITFWLAFSLLFYYLYLNTTGGVKSLFFYIWKIFHLGVGIFIILYSIVLSYFAFKGKRYRIPFLSKMKKVGR